MIVISHEDIKKLNISPVTCYEWAEEMIREKSKMMLPPKISLKPMPGTFCNVMPCIVNRDSGKHIGGVKMVTRYPDRLPSLDSKALLFDASNGDVLAFMDANWITAMRTGAVAAHSIKLLAKSDFSKISIMGLGNTARATMLVLFSIFPEKKFDVKLLKYKGQEESFAKRFEEFDNVTFKYVDTHEELIAGTDVLISCVTYAPEDFFRDEAFEKGILIVPVHTLGFTNCDLFFDKVFADDYGHVRGFKNFDKFKSFCEVSDVINGNRPGRENDEERIIAYNVGISIHDMFYAYNIWKMVMANKSISELYLEEPEEKFWI